eukprot:g20067.t1
MSSFDYTALQDKNEVGSPGLWGGALKAVAALLGGLCTLGGAAHLILHHPRQTPFFPSSSSSSSPSSLSSSSSSSSSTPSSFIPRQGTDAILTRPGFVGPVQLVKPPGSGGPDAPLPLSGQSTKQKENCIFTYGKLAVLLGGSKGKEAWVYGAVGGSEENLAHPTGFSADILKGSLVCFAEEQYEAKLEEANKVYGFTQDTPGDPTCTRRGMVWAVLQDGSATQATWYYLRRFDPQTSPRVAIFGGMGRVGQATFKALSQIGFQNTKVVGRTAPKSQSPLSTHFVPLGCPGFDEFRPGDEARALLREADIILNIMGPFQARKSAELLEALVTEKGKANIRGHPQVLLDVSDDYAYAAMSKKLQDKAKEWEVTTLTTSGLGPGMSNVLVAESLNEHPQEYPDLSIQYFTAGTGGLGPTILTTSFLLLGQDAHVYANGQVVTVPPCSDIHKVNFSQIGTASVVLLDLPDPISLGTHFRLNNSRGFFGTRPEFWNSLHTAIGKLPKKWLQSKQFCTKFALVSIIPTRIVDRFVGGALGMKIEIGDQIIDFYHPSFLQVAGLATALLAQGAWEQGPSAGVYFPEEFYTAPTRQAIIARARQLGCVVTFRAADRPVQVAWQDPHALTGLAKAPRAQAASGKAR